MKNSQLRAWEKDRRWVVCENVAGRLLVAIAVAHANDGESKGKAAAHRARERVAELVVLLKEDG